VRYDRSDLPQLQQIVARSPEYEKDDYTRFGGRDVF